MQHGDGKSAPVVSPLRPVEQSVLPALKSESSVAHALRLGALSKKVGSLKSVKSAKEKAWEEASTPPLSAKRHSQVPAASLPALGVHMGIHAEKWLAAASAWGLLAAGGEGSTSADGAPLEPTRRGTTSEQSEQQSALALFLEACRLSVMCVRHTGGAAPAARFVGVTMPHHTLGLVAATCSSDPAWHSWAGEDNAGRGAAAVLAAVGDGDDRGGQSGLDPWGRDPIACGTLLPVAGLLWGDLRLVDSVAAAALATWQRRGYALKTMAAPEPDTATDTPFFGAETSGYNSGESLTPPAVLQAGDDSPVIAAASSLSASALSAVHEPSSPDLPQPMTLTPPPTPPPAQPLAPPPPDWSPEAAGDALVLLLVAAPVLLAARKDQAADDLIDATGLEYAEKGSEGVGFERWWCAVASFHHVISREAALVLVRLLIFLTSPEGVVRKKDVRKWLPSVDSLAAVDQSCWGLKRLGFASCLLSGAMAALRLKLPAVAVDMASRCLLSEERLFVRVGCHRAMARAFVMTGDLARAEDQLTCALGDAVASRLPLLEVLVAIDWRDLLDPAAGFGDESSGLLTSACDKLGQPESSMAGLVLSEEAQAAVRTGIGPGSQQGRAKAEAKAKAKAGGKTEADALSLRWDATVKDNAPKTVAPPPTEPLDDGVEFDVLAYSEALETAAAPTRGRGRSQSTFSAGDRAAPPVLPVMTAEPTVSGPPALEAFDPNMTFDIGEEGMEEYDPTK